MAFPKGIFTQRLSGLTARVQHAFAVEPDGQPLSAEDLALLERVADAVVAREMAVPAVVFLESVGPMNFLGSQALHFFTPILEVVLSRPDLERVALLLERRDMLPRLTALIERQAEIRRAAARP